MAGVLISLDNSKQFFRACYGDFVTRIVGHLTNGDRLAGSLHVTAGTVCTEARSIDYTPDLGVFYADDCVEYAEHLLPITAANSAALLATGFLWTSDAATAAMEHRIAVAAVAAVRQACEEHHHGFRQLLEGLARGDKTAVLAALTKHAESTRGVVGWQAKAGAAYIISPESIVALAGAGQRKKWWQLWKPR